MNVNFIRSFFEKENQAALDHLGYKNEPAILNQFIMKLGVMQLPKKEIVIEYGDAGDLFFIILSGQVSVQKPVNKIFILEPVPQLNLTGDLKKRVNNVNLPTN